MNTMQVMRRYSPFADFRNGLGAWLAIGVCVFVILLCWYGYTAIVEWRRSYELLAERRSQEGADLLLEALTRDMQGAQGLVLNAREWDRFAMDRPYEMSSLVASSFARYPYPESFFAWAAESRQSEPIFFHRSDRRPPWMAFTNEQARFPVVTEQRPAIGREVLDRIIQDAARSRRLSAFNISLGGVRYQIVAQLNYSDVYGEKLEQVIGFTVNLPWVREHYFRELTKQVWDVSGGAEEGLTLGIKDGRGELVAGSPIREDDALTNTRQFELMFFNPDLVLNPPPELGSDVWSIQVSAAADIALLQAISAANRTLFLGAASALALGIGLVMTARAERANARLVEMRSEFVSAVTHELKTPIATIRAAAETWSQSRLSGIDAHTYGRLVVDEAKRLTRLVENLLAYSRVTDIGDVYSVEPIPVGGLFKDLQQEFEAQLDEAEFDLQINIAPEVSHIRGDRRALRLLFDNLIDNAIRYSTRERRLHINAEPEGRMVNISVSDAGIGIPAEEIPLVTRKFFRGSRAPSGGSGLGLAIAMRIAQDHGGRLSIQSTVGEGTTVTVRLPAA